MTRVAATLCLILALGIDRAAAQSDSLKESLKKTEKGAGELFRGMGQELKKFGGTLVGGTKKDAKKEAAKADEKEK